MTIRRKSLSTGDIARYCQVTPATVVNWIKAGKLEVYTTPGGQYRMDTDAFVTFLEQNRLPIPEDLQPSRERRVLLVDNDPEFLERATQAIAKLLPTVVQEESDNGFDGLIKLGAIKPHAVVLDLELPSIDAAEICRHLRQNQSTRNMFVIAIAAERTEPELMRRVRRVGVDVVLNRPVPPDELARTLARLLKVPVGA